MSLIFMSEHMFRSRDQSLKLQSEIFRIYKHGVVCRLTRTRSRYHRKLDKIENRHPSLALHL